MDSERPITRVEKRQAVQAVQDASIVARSDLWPPYRRHGFGIS